MGFWQNSSGRRRHHVIAPSILSLSRKHVDSWAVTLNSVPGLGYHISSLQSKWRVNIQIGQ